MARYSAFLGRRVEVQYRAGDILLPASGTFVADSGRSIFLEQNFEQRGQHKHFRWEIPYQPPKILPSPSPPSPARSPAAPLPPLLLAVRRVFCPCPIARRLPDASTKFLSATSASQFGYNHFRF